MEPSPGRQAFSIQPLSTRLLLTLQLTAEEPPTCAETD
jgi:hypothetical protein